MTTSGHWLISWPGDQPADERLPALVCLPPAGAGCHQFRAWQQPLAGVAEVVGVQPPGRENRWGEQWPEDFPAAAEQIAAELTELLGPDRRWVLFGHSLGALLGFEVARLMPPSAMVVSACKPPTYWTGGQSGIYETVEELRWLLEADADAESAVLADPDIRQMLLTMLQRDAVFTRTYVHRPHLLDIAVHAWGGVEDPTVSGTQLDLWSQFTTGPLHRCDLPGGHHAALRLPQLILPLLTEVIRGVSVALPTVSKGANADVHGAAVSSPDQ